MRAIDMATGHVGASARPEPWYLESDANPTSRRSRKPQL